MAQVMLGKTMPANQKPPSYWRALLGTIVNTQDPLGTGLGAKVIGSADTTKPDPKSVDKLANLNMQAFKAIALKYGGAASAKVFDLSPPLVQAQYIMDGMKGVLSDVSFPCPYTVYIPFGMPWLCSDAPIIKTKQACTRTHFEAINPAGG